MRAEPAREPRARRRSIQMKHRIAFVITVALALALCLLLGGWQEGSARADSSDAGAPPSLADSKIFEDCRAAAEHDLQGLQPNAEPRDLANEYGVNTTLSGPVSWPGDVRIDSGVTLDLNGNTLTITGNLDVFGTLNINGGTLTVKSGGLTVSDGLLQMASGSINVSGPFTTRGRDETGALTGGTITVKGDFIQYKDNSSKSFCPTGTKVVITGTGRLVSFDTPYDSWFGPYDFSGATFNSKSIFSLNLNLGGDLSLAYGNLFIRGQLNGHKLTVPANTYVEGPLTLGGGTLSAGGTLKVDYTGGISMTNANDKITVAGSLITGGVCSCQTGSVEINGDFRQYGLANGFHDNSWVCQSANRTKITGANRSVKFDSPKTSCFGQLDTSASGTTLTADSTLCLNFDLTSDATLSYSVGSICYGGHLNGHKLTVSNSPFLARQIVPGGGTLEVMKSFTSAADNCLIMTNANDRVIVHGDFLANQKMDPASVTAGEIDLYGNFTQCAPTGSPTVQDTFLASGANVVKLFGTNKAVRFSNPGVSWFGKLALNAGASFDATSVIAMKCDLDTDRTFNIGALYYSGSLKGHELDVTGNGILHIFGATKLEGGKIITTGSLTLDGSLTMDNDADTLQVGGSFNGSGAAALSAGSAVFKGAFHYMGTSYVASGTNTTTLSGGAGTSVIFDHPAQSYFAAVTLSPGTTLHSSSVLSVKDSGGAGMTFSVPRLYLQGTLGGKTVALTGSLTVPTGAALTIGGGTLNVSGDMVLDGALVMTNAADCVTVGGAFTAEGPDESNDLTNGRLTVKGNFTQKSTLSKKSFVCTLAHRTILSGAATQTVKFDDANVSMFSTFGTLYRINPDISFATDVSACSLKSWVTSADLLSISGTHGQLVPGFSAGKYNYIFVLSDGDSTTLTLNPLSGNATVEVNPAVYTSFPAVVPVNSVPDSSGTTVTIIVKAKDDVVENTYVVKVQKLDVNLKALDVTPAPLSLNVPFDPGTTGYSVALPADAESLTLTPQTDSPDSTFTFSVSGQGSTVASKTVLLKPGESADISIIVKGQDGTHTKTYTVHASRDTLLTGFGQGSVGALSPSVSSFVEPIPYTLTLSALEDTVTITPVKTGDCTNLVIGGVDEDSATYTLKLGETKPVTITAYASPTVSFTYTLTLMRDPIISAFYYPGQQRPGMTLAPAFDAEGDLNGRVGSGPFTLTVPASVTSLTIQPHKGPDCSQVLIDCPQLGITGAHDYIDLSQADLPPGCSVQMTITARAGAQDTGITRTFTLTVAKNPIVTGLKPNEGTLTQKSDPTKHTFDPKVTEYYLDVPATGDPVFVAPTLAGAATVTVNGQAWDPDDPVSVDPAPGAAAAVLNVTGTMVGSDGTGTVSYKINVVRHKPLTGISSAVAVSPAFSAATDSYMVDLPFTTDSVTITPAPAQGAAVTCKINGVVQSSLKVTLPLGGTRDVKIEATQTDAYGSTVTTYTVLVEREGLIDDIDASSGTFSPDFDGCTLNYNLYLASTASSVTLTPEKTVSCKSFTINDKAVTRLSLSVPAGGKATATIKAVGVNTGFTQTFKINVYRIAPVTSIALSSGKLSPAFSLGKSAYTVSVPASTQSVTIKPARADSCSSLAIDGSTTKTSVTLSPTEGAKASTTITATAVNGAHYTWTITVVRAAMLNGITLSPTSYKLSPAFSVTKLNYNVDIPATTASLKVTAQKASSGVRSMKINNHSVSSTTLAPPVGGTATATIVLTASDGKTKQTYTITVHRAPLLTGITTSVGTLSTAFDPAKLTYTVTIPADEPSTTLKLTRAATGVSSVAVGGHDVSTVPVPVASPGGSASVTIVATATGGAVKVTYTVTVKRAPVLSAITANGGKLSPAFSAGTHSYTITVPATTSKVTLKAIGTADCTSVTMNGTTVTSASSATMSKDYYPEIGGSVTATISAKTAGGATCTYTVKIVRAALITGIHTSSSTYRISPAFTATTLEYNVDIPASRSSITIYAAKASTGVKSVTMNGQAVTSLTVKPAAGSPLTVTIVATATDGVTKVTYKVYVNRDAS